MDAALSCALASLSIAGIVLLPQADAARQAYHGGHGSSGTAAAARPSPPSRTLTSQLHAAHPALRWPHPRCVADAALGTALEPILRRGTGSVAVGIVDRTTGATASYHERRAFHTASIVKADILAALLLNVQRGHMTLDQFEMDLASKMIGYSDNDAASTLWDAVGRAPGIAAANRNLGLRYTVPDEEDYWGLTLTTVTDQLRLLADLTSRRSPLAAASRHYEMSLLRDVEPGQDWGVTVAADPGTRSAVKNGWLPDPQGWWMINSIGVITRGGHQLLAAVLSSGQPSLGAGIAQVEVIAKAAAGVITTACQRHAERRSAWPGN